MASEYVKLVYAERVYGETNLLQSRLSVISINKNVKAYKELRKQELDLKLQLKKRIQETKKVLDELEKDLPIIKLMTKQKRVEKAEAAPEEREPEPEEEVMATGLEPEIEEIQKRLAQIT